MLLSRHTNNDVSIDVLLASKSEHLRLYGQAIKRMWWMPRRQEAMKDVVACEKPRGAGKQALIRGCPNGETHRYGGIVN